LYKQQGRYDEAETLYLEALAILLKKEILLSFISLYRTKIRYFIEIQAVL